MNNPYMDDKLFHMGFQVGFNACSFLTDQAKANVSFPGVGFRVGFVADLRLCKYLNLRCTPGLEFAYRTLNISSTQGTLIGAIPITLPVYLKFSAERVSNFRPYVLAGGGVSFNVNKYDETKERIAQHWLDYFCEAGFGCDIYFPWFKLCPEITYRIGFGNQLNTSFQPHDPEYMNIMGSNRLLNQAICLTFNFQN